MTVFTAALDCGTAEERAVFLDQACVGTPGLRERVEALFRAHDRGGKFLGPVDAEVTATLGARPAAGVSSARWAFDEELRRLLQDRLLLVHVLALGWTTLLVVLTLMAQARPGDPIEPHPGTTLWQMAPVLAECLIGTIVLGRLRQMSLPALRTWEVACFATPTAAFAYDRFLALSRMGPDVGHLPAVTLGFRGLYSLQAFVTLILAYGVLIPNTRRRSLFVVGALAAVPLAMIPAATLVNPVLRTRHVVPLVVQWALTLLFPSAIAVFTAAHAVRPQLEMCRLTSPDTVETHDAPKMSLPEDLPAPGSNEYASRALAPSLRSGGHLVAPAGLPGPSQCRRGG